MEIINSLIKNADIYISVIANLLTILVTIKSISRIFHYSKIQKEKSTSNTSTVHNYNTSINHSTSTINNFYGYSNYNFNNYGKLTPEQIDNYNYDSDKIWRLLYVPVLFLVIFYSIQYWINNPINLPTNTPEAIFTNIEVIMNKFGVTLSQAFQKTFNLTWLAQFLISILVIIKMLLTKDILYRKINIFLYTWSLIFSGILMKTFSSLSFTKMNFGMIISNSSNFSLEAFKPLFTWYAVILLAFQLGYTTYVLYSGIKILRIGELYYLKKRIRSKKINSGKYFIFLSPIFLSILWYYFKIFIY